MPEPKDPGIHQQVEATDFEEHQEVDASGRPLSLEVTQGQLQQGVELEEDPWAAHAQNHPTPEHPTGRLGP